MSESPTIMRANGQDVFRRKYRELDAKEQDAVGAIKDAAIVLHDTIQRSGSPSRAQSLALTKLEEAVMWAVKAIT